MPTPSSHLGLVTLMQDYGTLSPQMMRLVTLTRVIATLLFMYPQVHAYGSFHFCARRLEMSLGVAYALKPRRPSNKATKGMKCL